MTTGLNRTLVSKGCLALLLALAGSAGAAGAQQPLTDSAPPIVLPGSHIHTFRSQVNGRDYWLGVILPRGYARDTNAATRYPVLYVLDGNQALLPTAMAYKGRNPARDSLIIVGVGYPGISSRRLDYLPPPWPGSGDETLSGVAAGTCCAGDLFLRALREEILPLIHRTYRTSPDRGIWGHSLGGLFANYVLFEAPDLFDRYAIASPSLGVDNGPLFVREAEFAATHDSLPKRVVIWVGAKEGFMIYVAQRMATTLRAHKYRGLEVTDFVVPGVGHQLSGWDGAGRALRALYPSPQDPETEDQPAAADSARRLAQAFLAAYARRNTGEVLGLMAEDSAFQGNVDGAVVHGRQAYGALLTRRFGPWQSLDLRVKDLWVNTLDSPRNAVVGATYTVLIHLRSGELVWEDRDVIWELEQRPEGWRISYLLESPAPPPQ